MELWTSNLVWALRSKPQKHVSLAYSHRTAGGYGSDRGYLRGFPWYLTWGLGALEVLPKEVQPGEVLKQGHRAQRPFTERQGLRVGGSEARRLGGLEARRVGGLKARTCRARTAHARTAHARQVPARTALRDRPRRAREHVVPEQLVQEQLLRDKFLLEQALPQRMPARLPLVFDLGAWRLGALEVLPKEVQPGEVPEAKG